MAKISYHISIDNDLVDDMRNNKDTNWSSLINDFLRTYLDYEPKNDADFDKIKQELEENEQKKVEISKKISKLRYEMTILQRKREDEAKAQKEKIAQMKRCLNCQKTLNPKRDKIHNFPNGNVCLSCFYSASKEQLTRWGFVI